MGRGECKRYVEDANKRVRRDIKKLRQSSALNSLIKTGEKVKKEEMKKKKKKKKKKKVEKKKKEEEDQVDDSNKRFTVMAKTDPDLFNKSSRNAFIGVYITFGAKMSRFLGLKSGQRILIGHYGVPPDEDSNLYLKLRP